MAVTWSITNTEHNTDVDKDAVEASLTANIEEQKNPTTEDGVPW